MKNAITLRLTAAAVTLALGACAQYDSVISADGGAAATRVDYSSEIDVYISDKPTDLQAHYRALFDGGVRNAVLNQVRIGLAAMELGQFDDAEASFEGALQRIERVYVKDGKAKLAKSKFQKESIKDFKGEPYERAMAYLYRGLLYLREGDYDNARATFLGGEFQDTVANDETFQSDFAVLNYLAGWASQCEGDHDSADVFYSRALEHNPSLSRPRDGHNTLFIAGIGTAPVKVGTGKHKERLQFQRGQGFAETSVRFEVPGIGNIPGESATSVFWQANTRGGRPIEAILNGKAQFKDNTATAANVSGAVAQQLVYQASLTNNADLAGYGAAAAAAGLVFDMFSRKTTPAADTRYWDNLPDSLAVSTAYVDTVSGDVRAVFTGPGTMIKRPAYMNAGAGSCNVVWSRSRSAAAIPAEAPGSGLTAREKRKLRKALKAERQILQNELIAMNSPVQE